MNRPPVGPAAGRPGAAGSRATPRVQERKGRAMRRAPGQKLLKCALVMAAVAVAGGSPRDAGAAVSASGQAQLVSSYARFLALAAAAGTGGALPRLDDPVAAPVLAGLWDPQGLPGQPPYRAGDVAKLREMLALQVHVLARYVGVINARQASAQDARDLNYQAEIARAEVAMVRTMPALLEAAADAARGMDGPQLSDAQRAQRARLEGILPGIASDFAAASRALAMPGLSPSGRATIAAALDAAAPQIAAKLPRNLRNVAIRAAADTVAQADPPTASRLEHVILAFASQPCATLCRMAAALPQSGGAPQPASAPARSAPPVAAPPPAPAAAASAPDGAASDLLVSHPLAGLEFGAPGPRSCRSRTEPRSGPISPALARQYFICRREKLSNGALYLVRNVQIEVGRGVPPAQQAVSLITDGDTTRLRYPIRGRFQLYICDPLGGTDGIAMGPRNCSRVDQTRATGLCYVSSFGDWKCLMNDGDARQVLGVAPPGPLSSAALAKARAEAPTQALRQGVAQLGGGDFRGAAKIFKSVIKQHPWDPAANAWYGIAALRRGDLWASTFLNNVDRTSVSQALVGLNAWREGHREAAAAAFGQCIAGGGDAAAHCRSLQGALGAGGQVPALESWPRQSGLEAATRSFLAPAGAGN